MANSARQQRIGAELQKVLAELISREIKDPRVGSVTVTAVKVAPDMSAAKVLFVPFGSKHPVAEVQAGLDRAAGFLRGEVGRRLSLRHAPRLEFEYDETLERADHLTRLIDRAVQGSGPAGSND
ncbi:MAG: 30S ribosome-binding factor RbfA [Gammaproteobacteria bacterium]|jgi:ribosome-binding factor A|nr:30S ribosome-binding factor RbfA [Gammaproteobacteria bacterium]